MGLSTIADIAKERVRRVLKGASERGLRVCGGFKVLALDSSNIKAWIADASDLEDNLLNHSEHLVPGRSEQDVLYELLLKLGLDICVPIETRMIVGKSVYSVGAGALIVCLSDGITRQLVEELANGIVAWRDELAPAVDTCVVFKDSGFADDVAKTNMAAILNQNGIADVRSL
jgi:adenine-specific DNA-methyltransferase